MKRNEKKKGKTYPTASNMPPGILCYWFHFKQSLCYNSSLWSGHWPWVFVICFCFCFVLFLLFPHYQESGPGQAKEKCGGNAVRAERKCRRNERKCRRSYKTNWRGQRHPGQSERGPKKRWHMIENKIVEIPLDKIEPLLCFLFIYWEKFRHTRKLGVSLLKWLYSKY